MKENSSLNEVDLYKTLKENILNLKLKPGAIISMKDVSEKYQMGRTPVRDALLQLQNDGLLVVLPQRGIQISKISLKKAESERFIRECLESIIMLESMARSGVDSITKLEMSLDRQKKLCADERLMQREFMKEDEKFHEIFFQAAEREYCYSILKNTMYDYYRLRLLSLMEKGREKRIVEEHREIADAWTAQDAKRLQNAFNCHIHRLIKREIFLKYSDLFDEEESGKHKETDLNIDFLVETKLKYHM